MNETIGLRQGFYISQGRKNAPQGGEKKGEGEAIVKPKRKGKTTAILNGGDATELL